MSEQERLRIDIIEECSACKGTGIYQGMAEKDGFGVVCYHCKGTGRIHYVHEYREFTGRKPAPGVKRVIEVNPGICVGETDKIAAEDYGGMPYADWDAGMSFPPGSEMRKFVCPAWWFQSADYKKKPRWDECIGAGMFSRCKRFDNKAACWKRWDREFGGDGS